MLTPALAAASAKPGAAAPAGPPWAGAVGAGGSRGLCSRPPPPDPRKNTLVTFPSSLWALAGFRNFVVTEHLGATSVNHLLPGRASKREGTGTH